MKYLHFTKALCVALTPQFYEDIKAIAEQQRIPMSEWIRNVAAKELESNQEVSNK